MFSLILFSYRKFYVCLWKREIEGFFTRSSPRPYGLRGIHLKVVDSSTGPGYQLRDALWHTGSIKGQTQLLWHDPSVSWNFNITYRWDLLYNPTNGLIHIQWFQVCGNPVYISCNSMKYNLAVWQPPNLILLLPIACVCMS